MIIKTGEHSYQIWPGFEPQSRPELNAEQLREKCKRINRSVNNQIIMAPPPFMVLGSDWDGETEDEDEDEES
jgi:hypothetical protein